jgi:hypothetical protein
MKRKAPETERQPAGQPREIIDVDEIEASQDSGAGSNKRSWVWNHFKEHNGEAVCQVITKAGKICGKSLKKDKSASTKTFHAHLWNIHKLSDPSLTKKTKINHMDIKKWSKSRDLQPKVSFIFSTINILRSL